ncbi:MAG: zinc ribbon domain-containing protein [Candidatus Eisenbacteria bacterium]|nr:zinc ribbon domain-containing protein [Candidatus Eisenbacteria bacterium]
MPSYDYKCEKCGRRFTKVLTVSERDRGKVKCPKCDSTKVRQRVTGFSVITSKKS